MDNLAELMFNSGDSQTLDIVIKTWLHSLSSHNFTIQNFRLHSDFGIKPCRQQLQNAKHSITNVLTHLFYKKHFDLIKIIIDEIAHFRSNVCDLSRGICQHFENNVIKAKQVLSKVPTWVHMDRMNELSDLLVSELAYKRRSNEVEMRDYKFITQTLMDTLLNITDFPHRISKSQGMMTSILGCNGTLKQMMYIFDDVLNAIITDGVLTNGNAMQIAFQSIRTVVKSNGMDHHLHEKLVRV
eukprot:UN04828